ncbi:hypothetical protein BH11PAT3_BH11PAT3_1520 [soil metagenome]
MKKDTNNFDVIVIGAGSGGLNVAVFMNRIGLRVLLIDKTDERIGGDCLNFGCIPSKALIHVAREIYSGKKSEEAGFLTEENAAQGSSEGRKVNIKKVMAYIKEKQNIIRSHENAEHFRRLGMTVVLGEAKFDRERSVVVNDIRYHAKKIVLATGSRPRKLELPGIDAVRVYTNETVFDMEILPERFVFIGGGPISLELGQAFQMLGSKVTIVHGGKHILEKEDPDVSEFMEKELNSMGITIILNSKPIKFENGELIIKTLNEEISIRADALFAGIGRVLNIDNLDLENAKIKTSPDKTKLLVDAYLQTTNKNIMVAGDVAGGLMFTHAAEIHAKIVISNFFAIFKKKLHTGSFGWVTYTTPEIATFGSSAMDLKTSKIKYQEISSNLVEDDRAIVDESTGFLKLFVGSRGKLLGGTLIAPQAGEIIGELILAKSKNLKMADLFNRVAPYPTAARIIRKVAGNYESQKLTPKIMGILRFLWNTKTSL